MVLVPPALLAEFMAAINSFTAPLGSIAGLMIRLKTVGSVRSSSASNHGRNAGRCRGVACAPARGAVRFHFRSQDENHMILLLSGTGLRYNETAIPPARRPD